MLLTLPNTASAILVTTITSADGQGADAYVEGGTSANNNFGSSGNITLKNGNSADQYARKGYVRFDLAPLGGYMPVIDASLSLTVGTNRGGGSDTSPKNFTVEVFGLIDGYPGVDNNSNSSVNDDGDVHDEFWPETVVDWTSAPANQTNHGKNFNANATKLGQFNVTTSDVAGSVVTFSDPDLISFLNGDTNGVASLLLRRTSGGGDNLSFRSKEATSADVSDIPSLSITAVPEPTALLIWSLLAGLGVGLRWRRRKR